MTKVDLDYAKVRKRERERKVKKEESVVLKVNQAVGNQFSKTAIQLDLSAHLPKNLRHVSLSLSLFCHKFASGDKQHTDNVLENSK